MVDLTHNHFIAGFVVPFDIDLPDFHRRDLNEILAFFGAYFGRPHNEAMIVHYSLLQHVEILVQFHEVGDFAVLLAEVLTKYTGIQDFAFEFDAFDYLILYRQKDDLDAAFHHFERRFYVGEDLYFLPANAV
jgi:hypothetical protein